MRTRLAFPISTLRVPDVLLIDGALAVSDTEFRQKSLTRLEEIRDQAGTILMVTHGLGEIRSTCSGATWIDEGALRADGPANDVVDEYEQS